MPPNEIGSAATLKDMRTWARNSPTIGAQERRSSVSSCAVSVLIALLSCAVGDVRFAEVARNGSSCRPLSACRGSRGEQVHAQDAGDVEAGALAAHAVAGGVQPRREGAQGPLARGDGDDAAGDPGFRGQTDLEQPFAAVLVHPAGGEQGQAVAGDL